MAKIPKFQVYKGEDGQFYWRLRALNGRVVSTGGESYTTVGKAREAALRVAELARHPEAFVQVKPEDVA